MLFTFLKYIRPVWYFNLDNDQQGSIFPDYSKLSSDEKSLIIFDDKYTSRASSYADAAYQAIIKGYITNDSRKKLILKEQIRNIDDNYKFLRKYFNLFWSFYVLTIRIISFRNPLREMFSFYKSFKTTRLKVSDNVFKHEGYEKFESKLIDEEPLITVIVPTLNRYPLLKDLMRDIEKQIYRNFEVIIVDQSDNFNPDFYKQFDIPDLQVINQEEKALWKARNKAIQYSSGSFILLVDDDSRINHDWITEHLRCIEYFNADISSGVFVSNVNQPNLAFNFRQADFLATGNVMINRRVFITMGLFDRQFEGMRMGDAEFGLRGYLNGLKLIANYKAASIDLKASEGGLREMGSWDSFRPQKLLAPRPVPSVLYYYRKYFGKEAAIYAIIQLVPLSIMPYKFKKHPELLMLGYLLVIPIFPVLVLSVLRSWKISTRMLAEGPIVAELNG